MLEIGEEVSPKSGVSAFIARALTLAKIPPNKRISEMIEQLKKKVPKSEANK